MEAVSFMDDGTTNQVNVSVRHIEHQSNLLPNKQSLISYVGSTTSNVIYQ